MLCRSHIPPSRPKLKADTDVVRVAMQPRNSEYFIVIVIPAWVCVVGKQGLNEYVERRVGVP